jgi:hypothetical protein
MTEEILVEQASEPNLKRTIPRAFFPMSPAATAGEAILSDLIRGVCGTKASVKGWAGLKVILEEKLTNQFNKCVASDFVHGVEEAYTRANTTDRRKKKNKNRYLIPFHPDIGRCVRPEESRKWPDYYAMLMCSKDGLLNIELHKKILARLDALEPSNIVEEVIMLHLERDEGERKTPPNIVPYNADLALRFQDDLAAWLSLEEATSFEWLQGLGFLLTTYIMVDFIQLARNLDEEFDALGEG